MKKHIWIAAVITAAVIAVFLSAKGGKDVSVPFSNPDNERSSVRNTLLQRISWRKDGWPCFEGGKPAQEDMTPRF